MEFKVIIPIPKQTEYLIDTDYPEKAKRIAARKHQHLLPKFSPREIELLAHCFRVHPKSSGTSYKEPTFIEELYKRYYGG